MSTNVRASLTGFLFLAALGACALYAAHVEAQSNWTMTASATHVRNGQTVVIDVNGTPPEYCTYSGFSYPGQIVTPPSNTTTTYSMNCFTQGQSSVSVQASASGPSVPPSASLSANPASISQGASTLLSWSSVSTSACTARIAGGATVASGGPSGSVSVSPTTNTQYQVTCTATSGTNPTATAWVYVQPPAFDAMCRPSPTTVNVGANVNWLATRTGGISPFSYAWTGEELTGRTGSSVTVSYASPGEKLGTVSVTDSSSAGGTSVSHSANRRCTGPVVSTYWSDIHDESEGFEDPDAIALVKQEANVYFTDNGSTNVCLQEHIRQDCNPNLNQPEYVCNYGMSVTIHQGTGTRATTNADYPTTGGWQRDRYWGTAIGSTYSSGAQTITRACTVPATVNASAPNATLSANPISVVQGSSSTLTHSCTNSTSATISGGVGSVSATSGTRSVTPGSTTTYTLTCTGAGGSDTASATVTVTAAPLPTLAATCSPSPGSIETGESTTWTANPTGGTGTYTYSWSGHSGLTGTTRTVTWPYSTAGNKSGSVTITSGSQSITRSCGNVVVAQAPPPLDASCSVSPTNITTGGSATWTAAPTGGTGSYTYSWSGTNSLTGSGRTVAKTYTSTGNKSGSVTVSSGSQSVTRSCTNTVSVTNAAAPDLRIHTAPYHPYTDVPTAGESMYLYSATRNYGNATANAPFSVLYQRATSAAGANVVDIGAARNASNDIEAGTYFSGGSARISYTFPTGGTWYVRACADKRSASDGGEVVESEENNNCSGWVQINVVTPSRPDLRIQATDHADSGVAGTGTRLNGLSRNYGNASSGTGFYILYQRATSAAGANAENIGTAYRGSALGVNANAWSHIYHAFPSAGTWYVRVCTDRSSVASQDDMVLESNEGNNCGAWEPIPITAPVLPDLRVQATDYRSGPAGQPVRLPALIRNYGEASTGAGFTNLVQRATSAGGANALQIGTYQRTTALGIGTNFWGEISHSFPSEGTWYVRTCADKSSAADAGDIVESNENNNCSAWVPVSITEADPTGSLSCSVSDQDPAPGTTITYTVTPSGGASGPYVWNDQQGGSYGNGSTANRLISGAGPYVMTVDGDDVISPASCPVVSGVCANPSATIEASPTRVREGQTSTITWSAQGVDSSCTITGPGVSETVPGNSCTVPSDSATPTITVQSVYRISCDNGESTDEVVVNLIPEFEEF